MMLIIEPASLSQPQWNFSLRLPHCCCLTLVASLRLVDCCCRIDAESLGIPHWIYLTEQLTEAASLWLPHWSCQTVAVLCGCLTVALYLNLHPSSVRCCLIYCSSFSSSIFHYVTTVGLQTAIFWRFVTVFNKSDSLVINSPSNQRCLSSIACISCVWNK